MKFSKEKIVLEEYADFEKGEVIVNFPNIYYKVKMNNFFIQIRFFLLILVHALKALNKRTGQKFQEEGLLIF